MIRGIADSKVGDGDIIGIDVSAEMASNYTAKVENDIFSVASLAAKAKFVLSNVEEVAHVVGARCDQEGAVGRGIVCLVDEGGLIIDVDDVPGGGW